MGGSPRGMGEHRLEAWRRKGGLCEWKSSELEFIKACFRRFEKIAGSLEYSWRTDGMH